MTLLNRVIALIMLFVASATSAQGRSNWIVYANGPGFRVELPTEPTVKGGEQPIFSSRARADWKG
jgi:hypothetical protein